MLRQTQFVKSVLARHVKMAGFPGCFRVLSPEEKKDAAEVATEVNGQLLDPFKTDWALVDPVDISNSMFTNLCAGNHSDILKLAKRVAVAPKMDRFLSSDLYLIILQLLSTSENYKEASLALQLCLELCTADLDPQKLAGAFSLVLDCVRKSDDYKQLIPLRILYERLSSHWSHDFLEYKYIATVQIVLLRTFQYTRAIEFFSQCQNTYTLPKQVRDFYYHLPKEFFVISMHRAQDCSSIVLFLKGSLALPKECVPLKVWLLSLDAGLVYNDYELVKLVYESRIVGDLDSKISVNDVIFDNKLQRLQDTNPVFASLTDRTIDSILHCFASHGDVELCLSFIELHYVHRNLKGEKALSQELCIEIVRAYCYHQDLEIPTQYNKEDESMMRVIDVIHQFLTKHEGRYSYKEVADAVLYKLHTIRIYDEEACEELSSDRFVSKPHGGSVGIEIPRKRLAAKATSSQTTPLLKLGILKKFVSSHVKYIISNELGLETMRIFINCVLNHVNKYQNLSAYVAVLEALHKLNPNFAHQWLNDDLFEIFCACLRSSAASMAPGFPMFQYLKTRNHTFTKLEMEGFVFSALRNTEESSLLQYYLYNYLDSGFGRDSDLLTERITKWAMKSDHVRPIAQYLSEYAKSSTWKEKWNESGFVTRESEVPISSIIHSRYGQVDRSSLKRLQAIMPP